MKRIKNNEARTQEQTFYNQIHGKVVKKSGKNGYVKNYPGLLKTNFIIKTRISKNQKNLMTNQYFLSLKGCLFNLGFDFTKGELNKFLNNAAKHYLFFAYINDIKQKTSFTFVNNIFLKPIKQLITNNRIVLDDDFWLSFNLMCDICGNTFHKLYQKNMQNNNKKFLDDAQILINNTWYDEIDKEQWTDNMIEVYFQSTDSNYLNDNYDSNLLFVMMRSIHLSYYHTWGIIPPLKHDQKLKLPKILK